LIILIGSQKGGCGKSTIATNLASALAGDDVVLLDSDIQGTSARWSSDREESSALVVPCVQRTGNITSTVRGLAEKYKNVIIDSGGRDSQELRTGLVIADVSIHPFRPSQADLDTVFHLSEVITQALDFNSKLRSYALLTMCSTHHANNEIEDSKDYLSEHLAVLKPLLFDRKIYRDSLSEGLGVIESINKKAVTEFEAFTKAVLNG